MTSEPELLDLLPAAVYMTDVEGRLTFYNAAAAELWGYRPELGTTQWCGSWRLYWPDGRPMAHDECPMAVTLKEGRPVRGAEAIAERPDGTRVPFAPYPTPLLDAQGKVRGAINLLVDLRERNRNEMDSARLAAIVESSDDAIVSKTIDGRITSWNAAAARLFGYEPDEIIGEPITRIIPPELHDEEKDIIARLRRGERIKHYETIRVAKDGRRIDISLSLSPLRDSSGKVAGAAKVARDIGERKQLEALQRLLFDELSHRVKNTLATVQAIANQSLRHARSAAEFVSSFAGRLQALARADDLLIATKLQGADVAEILREQVLIGAGEDKRVTCFGPKVVLDARTTMHLALVLHELSTNARKHGALSVPTGRLSVQWEVRTNGGRNLVVEWKETGGRSVRAPRRRGFGSELIERTLKAHGGKASSRFSSEGLTMEITLPVPHQSPEMRYAGLSQDTPVAQSVSTPVQERTLKGKRILVVEDEPLVAMDLDSALSDAGCHVLGPAGSFSEAKALCADADCDAALLDANLAGHPVDELALMLTQRHIPFAFVTGYARASLPQGFQEAIILKKPFSEADLIATLELLVHGSAGVVPLRGQSEKSLRV